MKHAAIALTLLALSGCGTTTALSGTHAAPSSVETMAAQKEGTIGIATLGERQVAVLELDGQASGKAIRFGRFHIHFKSGLFSYKNGYAITPILLADDGNLYVTNDWDAFQHVSPFKAGQYYKLGSYTKPKNDMKKGLPLRFKLEAGVKLDFQRGNAKSQPSYNLILKSMLEHDASARLIPLASSPSR